MGVTQGPSALTLCAGDKTGTGRDVLPTQWSSQLGVIEGPGTPVPCLFCVSLGRLDLLL